MRSITVGADDTVTLGAATTVGTSTTLDTGAGDDSRPRWQPSQPAP